MHVSKVTQSGDKNNHGNDVLLTTHRLTGPGMCVILLKQYHFSFQIRELRLGAMKRSV